MKQTLPLQFRPYMSPITPTSFLKAAFMNYSGWHSEQLSPQQRKVFELSCMQGLSRDEVSEQLKISKATVSVHLTIAIRQVRAFFGDKS